MYCPNCKQEYDGRFCPECGTKLIEKPSNGQSLNLGDANAISGGVHLADSHNVHNEDRSVHNITNTTSTVNNITQVAAQKTEIEILQEKKTLYLNECKRAYEDNVLEQAEVVALEECRIKLGLDKASADAILESVRVMSERNARKTELNPIARTKLKILTDNLQKNEVKALMQQIDTLEPLVNKYEHDELSRKYFLVLAALKSEKCIVLYENTKTDNYWNTFWSYLAYIKVGRLSEAEDALASLDRFTNYPEDNMTVLAVAGAIMMSDDATAKELLNAVTGDYTPALQRFVDSIYLLLEPETAKEMGADENTCAFYLVNFFGQKDAKTKAEEERLRKEAEEAERKRQQEAEKKRKAEEKARHEAEEKAKREAEAKKKAAEEARLKAEAKVKAEEERKRKAEEAKRKKAEEAKKKAKAAETLKPQCSGTTREYEDHAKALSGLVKKIKEDWNGQARYGYILENGMGIVVRDDEDFTYCGIDNSDIVWHFFLMEIVIMKNRPFAFNSNMRYALVCDPKKTDGLYIEGNFPKSMKEHKESFENEKILSVAISENGSWVVVTDEMWFEVTGVERAYDAAQKAKSIYGKINSIALTDLGVIVCCREGVYYENIPTKVAEGIKQCINSGWLPTHISFTDSGTYFISNGKVGKDNKCSFYM